MAFAGFGAPQEMFVCFIVRLCEGLEEYGLDPGTAEATSPLLSCHSRGDQALSIPSHPWELLQSYSTAQSCSVSVL